MPHEVRGVVSLLAEKRFVIVTMADKNLGKLVPKIAPEATSLKFAPFSAKTTNFSATC
jgi:hypothetical protein